ncbi:hypothetical protein EDB89DRAFT_720461 [Lactarius sanguifluus]|nr:hypothetical protein EDB89DRAFT_720461 [Lactarius sanguifluus]
MSCYSRSSPTSSLRVIDNTCRRSWLGWPPHPCSISMLHSTASLVTSRFRIFASLSVIQNGSQSVDEQPFRVIIREPVSLEQMGQELSGPLSTVEELIIEWSVDPWYTEGRVQTDQWRGFCYHVPQVKMIRVQNRVALDIAHSFQQDGQEAALDLLPTLERVEVRSVLGKKALSVSICDAFEPFIAARKRAGRPVRLS